MDQFIAQAKALVQSADEAGRKQLIDGLRNLSYSLEGPGDAAQRIMYSQLQIAAVRIGIHLNLFNVLKDSPDPISVDRLAETTGASPLLLARILRYLASVGTIKETSKGTYTSNNVTEAFTRRGFQAGICHYHDIVGPVLTALPDYLKETNFKDITDPLHTAFQKAWNTELPVFAWYPTKPENFANFNEFMVGQREYMPTWLDVYPYEEKTKDLKADQPFCVDVGGGFGHQSSALRNKLPNLPNKIILQDIPATLEHAAKHPGVDVVVQDFFQPQAVKGARIYYMRNILHDWPEDKAITILKNTMDAMGPDSVLLIDEMVVPDAGAHWQATQIDLVMMSSMASLERTDEQWRNLITRAGGVIKKIYTYTESIRDSIIEVVPA